MRALLIVNPNATSTSPRVRDVIVHALASELDLDVVTTERRGHARELARDTRGDDIDVVLCLGGDGTVNEIVNGLLADGPDPSLPAVGPVPGGSANVFARALGLPADPMEATGVLLEAIDQKRSRTIGLGTAAWDSELRWFAFNAGLGIDAEVVAAMEAQRADGATATAGRYARMAVAQYARSDRRHPALTLHRPGLDPVPGVYYAFVQNTAPWTFLGPVRLDPCPRASFDTGIDLFAARSMGVLRSLRNVRRMFIGGGAPGNGSLLLHDQTLLELRVSRPTTLQVDGDHCGEVTDRLTLRSVPASLRVIC